MIVWTLNEANDSWRWFNELVVEELPVSGASAPQMDLVINQIWKMSLNWLEWSVLSNGCLRWRLSWCAMRSTHRSWMDAGSMRERVTSVNGWEFVLWRIISMWFHRLHSSVSAENVFKFHWWINRMQNPNETFSLSRVCWLTHGRQWTGKRRQPKLSVITFHIIPIVRWRIRTYAIYSWITKYIQLSVEIVWINIIFIHICWIV